MDKEQVAKKIRERIERVVRQFHGKPPTPQTVKQMQARVEKEIMAMLMPTGAFRLDTQKNPDGSIDASVTLPKWLSDMIYEQVA